MKSESKSKIINIINQKLLERNRIVICGSMTSRTQQYIREIYQKGYNDALKELKQELIEKGF